MRILLRCSKVSFKNVRLKKKNTWQMWWLIWFSNQVSRGSPAQAGDASSPMQEASSLTTWTWKMTPEAGVLTWTWSSFTSTPSTGSLVSSYSASFATYSFRPFDGPGSFHGTRQKQETAEAWWGWSWGLKLNQTADGKAETWAVRFNEKPESEFKAGGRVWWRENNCAPACYRSLLSN